MYHDFVVILLIIIAVSLEDKEKNRYGIIKEVDADILGHFLRSVHPKSVMWAADGDAQVR